MEMKGRVAIVTGGADGIGRATAERFAQAGASGIVLADIRAEAVEAAAHAIATATGARVTAVCADVSDPAQVDRMIDAALREFSQIDVLFNNAGICPRVPWDETTLEDWNRVLAVNVTSMYLCTRAVVPHMVARHRGVLVFMASEAAFVGSLVGHVAYGVSKAGAVALMQSVAKGFASHGIRANAVAPGPVDTALHRALGADFYAACDDRTLLKRHASPFEVADVVLFLASDASSYVTGQVIRVNAGSELI